MEDRSAKIPSLVPLDFFFPQLLLPAIFAGCYFTIFHVWLTAATQQPTALNLELPMQQLRAVVATSAVVATFVLMLPLLVVILFFCIVMMGQAAEKSGVGNTRNRIWTLSAAQTLLPVFAAAFIFRALIMVHLTGSLLSALFEFAVGIWLLLSGIKRYKSLAIVYSMTEHTAEHWAHAQFLLTLLALSMNLIVPNLAVP